VNDTLQRQMTRATKWSAGTELAAKFVAPVTNMILARLLSREAFGVVATVQIVVSFADLFTDAGFQKYLIQREFADDRALSEFSSVAFWTNFALSLLIWSAIALFRAPIAALVGGEGLGNVIAVSCAAILLTSFSSIQMALYRRRFDFKTLFYVRIMGILIPFLVTVPLALWLKNYWALTIGTLATYLSNAVILMWRSPWRPKWYFSFQKLREMLSFSMWSLLEALSIWLTMNVDIFIVSRFFAQDAVGLYKTSMNTANTLLTLVTASTTPVLFAALSRLQSDEDAYRRTFFKFQRMVAMLVMPLGVGMYCYSGLLTKILLGAQWAEGAELIGAWGLISAIMIIFTHYNSEVFRSRGRPMLSLLAQMLHLVVLVPGLYFFARYGFEKLFYARALLRFESMFVSLLILFIAFKISFVRIVKNVFPTMLAAGLMGALALLLRRVSDALPWQIGSIILCAAFYFAVLMMNKNMRKEILEMPQVKKVLRRGR
jgi:PST family polysaccharide transporter